MLQNTSLNLCTLLLIIIMYFMLDFTATINYVRVDYKSVLQRCWSITHFLAPRAACSGNGFRREHILTCALSLQFCTELNQPILPNIRKWKGPRGCWKAVVSEKPTTQLQKVCPHLQNWAFLSIFFSPDHRHLKSFSFANIVDVILYFCPFFSSGPFVSKCPGSPFLFGSIYQW